MLGPLDVFHRGRRRTPTSPKLRNLLALLALRVGRIVTLDEIIEELWGANPPRSVLTTVQTYVYQLRKLYDLDEGSDGETLVPARCHTALATALGGYILTVPGENVDVCLLETLSRRGCEEFERNDFEGASNTLRTATMLFRGLFLSDVGYGSVLTPEAIRVRELYRAVLDRRIDADIRLERDCCLIDEIVTLAAEQPRHEGLQLKLMLILDHLGRQPEALAVYHRTCAVLSDELGLEPSRELQETYQWICTDRAQLLRVVPDGPGT